jgi:DegV family protein with EDD domain
LPAHQVALLTDSTCDLSDGQLARYGISYVPSFILWGDDALRDRIDISATEFYHRLRADPRFPTTAHPTPGQFARAYESAQHSGAREIVVVTVSSAMSGTYNAAAQAGTQAPLPVHVVDSKGPTMSLGWQVLAAARAREAGGDAGAMVEAAARVRAGLQQYVMLDTLEFLAKGGRIGRASQFIGTLLNIKPFVYINHETGLVEAGERHRTRKRALEALYQAFIARMDTTRPLHVAVLHGDCLPDAEAMAGRIRQEHAPAELLVAMTTPVLGVHTGPGAVALCGYAL